VCLAARPIRFACRFWLTISNSTSSTRSRSSSARTAPENRPCWRVSPPDFLSHSHGEGFLRFFEERCQRQGIFIFDEPESALSPSRQIEFLKLLQMMDKSGRCQVIMATHSPMLMSYPNATLLRLTKYGLDPTTVESTDHYKTLREFFDDPRGVVEAAINE
jgi:predicted ATPase